MKLLPAGSRALFLLPLIAAILLHPTILGPLLTSDGAINSPMSRYILYALEAVLLAFAAMEYLIARERIPASARKLVIGNLAGVIIAVFVAIEIYYRARPLIEESPAWLELLTDFPGRDQFLSDRIHLKTKEGETTRKRYYDYHIYAFAPNEPTKTINFTDYYSARLTPDSAPAEKAETIVWTFGGSTMENMETTDDLTIANTIARRMNPVVRTRVVNFGTGSFQSSIESVKYFDLLRRVDPSERPDYAVFYDGFNDAIGTFWFGAGNLQKDAGQKLALMVEGRDLAAAAYCVSRAASRALFCLRPLESFFYARVFTAELNDFSEKNFQKGVSIYLDNLRMINAVSREFGVKPMFFLQPMIFTRKKLTPMEEGVLGGIPAPLLDGCRRFYAAVRRSELPPNFYDITDIFDEVQGTVFIDMGHTGPYAGTVTGRVIGEAILADAKKRR